MSKLGRNAKAPSSVPASAGPNDFEDGWDRTNASGGKAISPKLVNENKKALSESIKYHSTNRKIIINIQKYFNILYAKKVPISQSLVRVRDSIKKYGVSKYSYDQLLNAKAKHDRSKKSYRNAQSNNTEKSDRYAEAVEALEQGEPYLYKAVRSSGILYKSKVYDKETKGREKEQTKWRKCSKNYKRGCSGDMVKTIQSHLGFKEEDIDGKFGGVTERAVVEFQEKHGLKTDGIVGEKTYKKLSQIALAGKPKASPNPAKEFHKKTSGQVKANDKKGSLSKKEENHILREEDEVIEEKHPVGNGPRPVNESVLKEKFVRLWKTERS